MLHNLYLVIFQAWNLFYIFPNFPSTALFYFYYFAHVNSLIKISEQYLLIVSDPGCDVTHGAWQNSSSSTFVSAWWRQGCKLDSVWNFRHIDSEYKFPGNFDTNI